MPNTDTEDMLIRMFAPRETITSQPDDPARRERIWQEWRAFYLLTEWGENRDGRPERL